MSEPSNKEIIDDAMLIDEADYLQEDIISNNIGNDIPSMYVEHEGTIVHKASLLKYAMSGTFCPKSLDRMKRAAGFSRYKNSNNSAAVVLGRFACVMHLKKYFLATKY